MLGTSDARRLGISPTEGVIYYERGTGMRENCHLEYIVRVIGSDVFKMGCVPVCLRFPTGPVDIFKFGRRQHELDWLLSAAIGYPVEWIVNLALRDSKGRRVHLC